MKSAYQFTGFTCRRVPTLVHLVVPSFVRVFTVVRVTWFFFMLKSKLSPLKMADDADDDATLGVAPSKQAKQTRDNQRFDFMTADQKKSKRKNHNKMARAAKIKRDAAAMERNRAQVNLSFAIGSCWCLFVFHHSCFVHIPIQSGMLFVVVSRLQRDAL